MILKLDKARSVSDYRELRDAAASARDHIARDAEMAMTLVDYAARIEAVARDMLRNMRGDA